MSRRRHVIQGFDTQYLLRGCDYPSASFCPSPIQSVVPIRVTGLMGSLFDLMRQTWGYWVHWIIRPPFVDPGIQDWKSLGPG